MNNTPKYTIGQRVKFFAFIKRVGTDEGMRSWVTTGTVIPADPKHAACYHIAPDEKEYIDATKRGPRNGRSKTVFRAEGEVLGLA